MKKKVVAIVIGILIVATAAISVFLFSNNRPFRISYDSNFGSEIIDADISELETLAAEHKSFLVFVSMPECSAADVLEDSIQKIISDTKLQFYKISFMYLRDTDLASPVRHYPSLLIFKNGQLLTCLDSTSDDDTDAFMNADGLRKWLKKYIILQE